MITAKTTSCDRDFIVTDKLFSPYFSEDNVPFEEFPAAYAAIKIHIHSRYHAQLAMFAKDVQAHIRKYRVKVAFIDGRVYSVLDKFNCDLNLIMEKFVEAFTATFALVRNISFSTFISTSELYSHLHALVYCANTDSAIIPLLPASLANSDTVEYKVDVSSDTIKVNNMVICGSMRQVKSFCQDILLRLVYILL